MNTTHTTKLSPENHDGHQDSHYERKIVSILPCVKVPHVAKLLWPRLGAYLRLTRMHRPIGILLLLWPTLWALWLAAKGIPPLGTLAIFVVGTVLMRASGCAFNDYFDRDFDPHVARTRNRPLAAGEISPREALIAGVMLSLCALLMASLLPIRALFLAIPGAVLAISYPYAKRYTDLPQVYLGIAFSWGIPMAFAAIQEHPNWVLAIMLMAANLSWTVAYDTLYAMSDRPDDLKIGVRSSAILFGRHDRLIVGLFYLLTLLILTGVGLALGLGFFYYLGLITAAGCAVWYLNQASDRLPAACFKAFIDNNWFGAAIFIGLFIDEFSAHFFG